MRRYRRRKNYNNSGSVLGIFVLIYFFSKVDFGIQPILKNIYLYAGIFFIIFISFYFIKKIRSQMKQRAIRDKYLKSRIYEIDQMQGIEFENLLKAHFEKLGYKVKLTPASNDFGADLVLYKDHQITVVQAKRYKDKVNNKAVQEVAGAIGKYKADKGMVVTNSFFTKNAIELARANNIELWNRNTLIDNFKL